MNVFYDNIVFHLQNAGGISTYWSELIKRSIRDNLSFKFIDAPNLNLAAKELKILDKDIYERIGSPLIINRFINPKLKSITSPFVFHSSYNRTTYNKMAKNVLTVHDFVHEKYYDGLRKQLHCSQKNKAIINADKLIVVSESTKRDLLTYHPYLDTESVKVIYNGVSDDFFIDENVHHAGPPYFLFVGSRERYKNFDFAISLLNQCPGYYLYIVGKQLTEAEIKSVTGVANRIKVFTGIDNIQLNLLYNSAFALLYPSSYEGFGIPLLEAMKAGLPFIALNKSSIPEVAGDAGELIEELDIDLFKIAIDKIVADRQLYIDKGLKQAALFSWEKCYQATVKIYSELI